MFYNSQSQPEKLHIVKALQFELGKVTIPEIKERMLTLLHQVDSDLAAQVSEGLGLKVVTEKKCPFNHSVPADGDPKDFDSKPIKSKVLISPALSMANTVFDTIKSRQIAILIADGFDSASVKLVKTQLEKQGAQVKMVAPRLGQIKGEDKSTVEADQSLFTTSSALFDALYIPGGKNSVEALLQEHAIYEYLKDAFIHGKTIASTNLGEQIVQAACRCPVANQAVESNPDNGIILSKQQADDNFVSQLSGAIAKHRHWSRVK
jgi:catalase